MTRIDLDGGKYTVLHDNGADLHALRHGGPWRDLGGDGLVLAMVQEIEELRDKCRCLTDSHSALEQQRPYWAKGYSSDSVAAQSATGAISQLWELLGANNQTTAITNLRSLKNDNTKQRELLRELSNWLVCEGIATPEDMAQSFTPFRESIDALLDQKC